MENAVVTTTNSGAIMSKEVFTSNDIRAQINLIQTVMKDNMKDGEHYGKIPGCGDKPTLLKAGSEKLLQLFRLGTRISGEREPHDLGNNHREYTIKTTLFHIPSGREIGEGVGTCSTMESKFRYRGGVKEFTGKPVPHEYWNERKTDPTKAQSLIGGKGFSTGKNPDTGQWEITRQGEKMEHPDPADLWNTALKMAKKRSLVDATLTATSASDIFTQDIEELTPENRPVDVPHTVEEPAAPPPQHQPQYRVDPERPTPDVGAPPPSDDDAPYNQPAAAPPPEQAGETPQQKMWRMLVTICDGDETQAVEQLVGRTAFKTSDGKQIKGKSDYTKVSEKQSWFIIKDIEKAYKAATSKG